MADDFKIWVAPRSDNLTASLNAILDEAHGFDFDVKKGNLAALPHRICFSLTCRFGIPVNLRNSRKS
jgi:hypothetical protein